MMKLNQIIMFFMLWWMKNRFMNKTKLNPTKRNGSWENVLFVLQELKEKENEVDW